MAWQYRTSQRYSVSARLDGYGEEQKQQVAADSEGVDFVLRKAGTIAGRVVSGPNSAPIANFTRALSCDDSAPFTWTLDTTAFPG